MSESQPDVAAMASSANLSMSRRNSRLSVETGISGESSATTRSRYLITAAPPAASARHGARRLEEVAENTPLNLASGFGPVAGRGVSNQQLVVSDQLHELRNSLASILYVVRELGGAGDSVPRRSLLRRERARARKLVAVIPISVSDLAATPAVPMRRPSAVTNTVSDIGSGTMGTPVETRVAENREQRAVFAKEFKRVLLSYESIFKALEDLCVSFGPGLDVVSEEDPFGLVSGLQPLTYTGAEGFQERENTIFALETGMAETNAALDRLTLDMHRMMQGLTPLLARSSKSDEDDDDESEEDVSSFIGSDWERRVDPPGKEDLRKRLEANPNSSPQHGDRQVQSSIEEYRQRFSLPFLGATVGGLLFSPLGVQAGARGAVVLGLLGLGIGAWTLATQRGASAGSEAGLQRRPSTTHSSSASITSAAAAAAGAAPAASAGTSTTSTAGAVDASSSGASAGTSSSNGATAAAPVHRRSSVVALTASTARRTSAVVTGRSASRASVVSNAVPPLPLRDLSRTSSVLSERLHSARTSSVAGRRSSHHGIPSHSSSSSSSSASSTDDES